MGVHLTTFRRKENLIDQECAVLRVMPSDNSCLFTAFGGALPSQVPAPHLRKMMAEYIHQHPEIYNEAVLGSPPQQYCQSIQDPDRWGGGIELSILSSIFEVQIITFDVQVGSMETNIPAKSISNAKEPPRRKDSLNSVKTSVIGAFSFILAFTMIESLSRFPNTPTGA